jgi:hypothetical protein
LTELSLLLKLSPDYSIEMKEPTHSGRRFAKHNDR